MSVLLKEKKALKGFKHISVVATNVIKYGLLKKSSKVELATLFLCICLGIYIQSFHRDAKVMLNNLKIKTRYSIKNHFDS